jgi:hypothetical protein
MATHLLNGGIQVSAGLNSGGASTTDPAQMVWYQLTDDNREPIKISYEVIEKTNRMADGTLRRYVIARKHKITASWANVWSKSTISTDYGTNKGKAGAWLRSFYEANVFVPIYVKIIASSETTQNLQTSTPFVPNEDTYVQPFNASSSANMVYNVFMTQFDYEVLKRNRDYDMVNMNIEFTEI